MSQAKVNKYKEEKANRKQILKKQKRNRILARIAAAVICLAIVGWIGYSVYDRQAKKDAAAQTAADLSAVQDYLSGLTTADTDADISEGEDEATDNEDQDNDETPTEGEDTTPADADDAPTE